MRIGPLVSCRLVTRDHRPGRRRRPRSLSRGSGSRVYSRAPCSITNHRRSVRSACATSLPCLASIKIRLHVLSSFSLSCPSPLPRLCACAVTARRSSGGWYPSARCGENEGPGGGGRPMPVPGFIFLLGMISGLEWGGEARIEAGEGGGEDSKPALGFIQRP